LRIQIAYTIFDANKKNRGDFSLRFFVGCRPNQNMRLARALR